MGVRGNRAGVVEGFYLDSYTHSAVSGGRAGANLSAQVGDVSIST